MAYLAKMILSCSRGVSTNFRLKCNVNLSSQLIINRGNHHGESKDNNDTHDIIITGGGIIGTTLAVALGQLRLNNKLLLLFLFLFLFSYFKAGNRSIQSKRILLLEGGTKQQYKQNENYSNRVLSLNQHTRTLLSSIGVWKNIEAHRLAPVRKMQVYFQ